MSERKNLKWICRRCVKTQKGLEIERDTELEKKCSFCGTMTWCFLVASSRLVESKTPQETAVEAESVEVNEAIEEVIKEAVEAELEVEEQREESPEETAPAEAVEPIVEEVAAPSPEEEAAVAKKAKIAALEAELEALTE